MDISFELPQVLVPFFVGLIFVALGAWMLNTSNLLVRLLGIVIALGGVSVFLTAFPNDWVPPGIKFILVILAFIALSTQLARSGWKTRRGASILGGLLVLLGVLALIVQIGAYMTVPTGSLQDVIQSGFESLSQIFGLAATQLD